MVSKLPTSFELQKAADKIKKAGPDQFYAGLGDLIGDAPWFREYCQICLAHPLGNAILGAIVFGYQLRDKVSEMEQKVHLA